MSKQIERVFTQTFGVVGAIIERQGKFLLVRENGKGDEFGTWNQPAGWLDVGEDPIAAVKREVTEETGFDFSPTGVLGIYSLAKLTFLAREGMIHHAIKLIFVGKVRGQGRDQADDEISEIKWFTPDEIAGLDGATLRDGDIHQEVRDYLAGRRYPLELIRHTQDRS